MIDRFIKGNYFLSNFSNSFVTDELGIQYPTIEHAYQASKTLDKEKRLQLKKSSRTPGISKKLGNEIKLRSDWEEVKFGVMEYFLRQKFKPETFLAKRLISTHPHELVEGNYHDDKIWGFCLKTKRGENNLGKILMKIRNDLIGAPSENN
jgi:ribA/ribD-fused uncharacterized protein